MEQKFVMEMHLMMEILLHLLKLYLFQYPKKLVVLPSNSKNLEMMKNLENESKKKQELVQLMLVPRREPKIEKNKWKKLSS